MRLGELRVALIEGGVILEGNAVLEDVSSLSEVEIRGPIIAVDNPQLADCAVTALETDVPRRSDPSRRSGCRQSAASRSARNRRPLAGC